MDPLDAIRQRLDALRVADLDLTSFGASQHKYNLGPVLSEEALGQIEEAHAISLPEDYRQFLLHVGNGGAGPYYGIYSLTDAITHSGIAKDTAILSKPFPLEKPLLTFDECAGVPTWDDYFKRIETDEDYYEEVLECKARFYKPYYKQGTLYLCDYGDAIAFRLVVTGPERGNIWIEDMAGDFGGFFPLSPDGKGDTRTGFVRWYENWLDQTLLRLAGGADDAPGYFDYA